MNRSFHVIHYLVDPFAGIRRPVGAILVRGRTFEIIVPSDDASTASPFLRRVLRDLPSLAAREGMPRTFGPRIVIDPARDVPDDVPDAPHWIETHFLSRRVA